MHHAGLATTSPCEYVKAAEQARLRCCQDETAWAHLNQLAGKYRHLERRPQELRASSSRIAAEVNAEAGNALVDGGDSTDFALAIRKCAEHLDESRKRTAAALESLNSCMSDYQRRLETLAKTLEALCPLADAWSGGRWWTAAWWRALFQGGVAGSLPRRETLRLK